MTTMLKFDMNNPDIYIGKVWGDTKAMSELLGKDLSEIEKKLGKPVGEVFLASTHPDGISHFEGKNNNWQRKKAKTTIEQAIRSPAGLSLFGQQITMIKAFPIFLKYLSAQKKLSVQNHLRNKVKAWVSLSQGTMLYGLTLEGKMMFQEKQAEMREIMEETSEVEGLKRYFNLVEFSAGETYLIQPGIVHTLLKGSLFEPQKNRSLTYKGGEHGRKYPQQEIEFEKFAQALCLEVFEPKKIQPISKESQRSVLVATDDFAVESLEIKLEENYTLKNETNNFYLMTVKQGEIEIVSKRDGMMLKQGETALLSADSSSFEIRGEGKAFLTYIPDLEKDIIRPLKNQGATKERIINLGGPVLKDNDIYVQMEEMTAKK